MAKLKGKAKANARKKARKSTSPVPHIRHKENGGDLVGFYWGYNADKPHTEGFELTNIHLINMGMSHKDALMVGKNIKTASDIQLSHYVNNETMKHYGLTREEFVQEEWNRLRAVIHNISIMNGKTTFNEALKDYMIGCCAISTLVAAGEIPQDTYNGDKFSYSFKGNNAMMAFA